MDSSTTNVTPGIGLLISIDQFPSPHPTLRPLPSQIRLSSESLASRSRNKRWFFSLRNISLELPTGLVWRWQVVSWGTSTVTNVSSCSCPLLCVVFLTGQVFTDDGRGLIPTVYGGLVGSSGRFWRWILPRRGIVLTGLNGPWEDGKEPTSQTTGWKDVPSPDLGSVIWSRRGARLWT